MKLFNVIFIVLFIFSAAVQYNDPDPYLWIPLYLSGAFLCWQAIRGHDRRWLFIAALVAYSGYAMYLFFEKNGVLVWAREHEAESIVNSMKATTPWIEETREFFGLLLLIFAVVANIIWLSKNRRVQHSQNL